jgi:hypothetical protein
VTSTHDGYFKVVGFAEENCFGNIFCGGRKDDEALGKFVRMEQRNWIEGTYCRFLSCSRPSLDAFCVGF